MEAVNVPDYRDVARRLWMLLDDIDTLDDACRSDDAAFRKHTRDMQRKRFEILSGEQFDALSLLRAELEAGGEATVFCPTCGSDRPYSGTCGTSPDDTNALCNRAASPVAADTQGDAKDAARVLAEFAKTAPGRLPQRVQDAIAIALGDAK